MNDISSLIKATNSTATGATMAPTTEAASEANSPNPPVLKAEEIKEATSTPEVESIDSGSEDVMTAAPDIIAVSTEPVNKVAVKLERVGNCRVSRLVTSVGVIELVNGVGFATLESANLEAFTKELGKFCSVTSYETEDAANADKAEEASKVVHQGIPTNGMIGSAPDEMPNPEVNNLNVNVK